MVSTHPEVVIWLVLVLLYFSDLGILLFLNEVLLFETAGKFSAHVVHSDITIRKKQIYILNPFVPQTLPFRIPWGLSSGSRIQAEADERRIRQCSSTLRYAKRLCVALGALLFVGFPLLSVVIGFEYAFVVSGIVGYSLLFVIIAIVVRKRTDLSVRTDKAASLMLVACLCIPLAVNICRRLSLLVEVHSDVSDVLGELLEDHTYRQVAREIVSRAEKEIGLGLEEKMEQDLKRYINEAFLE